MEGWSFPLTETGKPVDGAGLHGKKISLLLNIVNLSWQWHVLVERLNSSWIKESLDHGTYLALFYFAIFEEY